VKKVLHIAQSFVIIGVLFFAHVALTIHHFEHHSHAGQEHNHTHDSSSKEDCPVCEFDFAAFALYGQVTIELHVAPWLRPNNDHILYFAHKAAPETNFLRGPPELM
jgi:hypothetical protein